MKNAYQEEFDNHELSSLSEPVQKELEIFLSNCYMVKSDRIKLYKIMQKVRTDGYEEGWEEGHHTI